MANVCAMCPATRSTSTIRVINQTTGESIRLCRPHFLVALNRCDKRTRRGIVSAVRRQAGAR